MEVLRTFRPLPKIVILMPRACGSDKLQFLTSKLPPYFLILSFLAAIPGVVETQYLEFDLM